MGWVCVLHAPKTEPRWAARALALAGEALPKTELRLLLLACVLMTYILCHPGSLPLFPTASSAWRRLLPHNPKCPNF